MRGLVHKLVSAPAIYDISQKLAGGDITKALLKKEFLTLPKTGSALDVGGGTGFMRSLVPTNWKYTCLDNDPQKLSGFSQKFPKDVVVRASATKIPMPNNTYDLCILSAVSHHLSTSEFEHTLVEMSRVLRSNGKFLFLDALLTPDNVAGKILWALDRGSFPRTLDHLKCHIEKIFVIKRSRFWKVFHEYAFLFCDKKQSP